MRSILAVLVALTVLATPRDHARASDAQLCGAAIERAEAAASLPPGLLGAVAVSESGKYDRARRGAAPWPWTVNNAGDGRYFASKAEAMAHVDQLRAKGERNIDVGCMQISLLHHPEAFASLDDAFEPVRNVGYGADFLGRLQDETGSWTRAVERYHTADPERGRAYREKVYERWQEARAGEPPAVDHPRGTRMALAAADHGQPRPAASLRIFPERRRLQPLSGRGFVSFAGEQRRVAVLRPSAAGQLHPIVRPPRLATRSLVRLMPLRRTASAADPGPSPAGHNSMRPLL